MRAVNLIPSDQRASTKPAGKKGSVAAAGPSPVGAYAILAFLALAVVAVALYVMTGNTIKEKEAELAQVEQEATAVEAQAAELQSFADFQQLSQARESTVRALASSRFAWPSTLDDIARALPEDVYIASFDGATTSAASGSSLRATIQAPSIELHGCTDDQASVARLMSSLREVRGVTRVTLAKSEAVDTVSTAAAPAPATATDEAASVTTEPCPSGSPPAFDMIVFFERAALSPAAAPNGAVATPAAGPTGPAGAVSKATTPPADPAATTSTTSTTP